MNASIETTVKSLAKKIGFDLVGITDFNNMSRVRANYKTYINQGFHADMNYIARFEQFSERFNWAKSVIMVALVYNTPYPFSINTTFEQTGWISRYAWGRNYHKVVSKMLKQLIISLKNVLNSAKMMLFNDTASIPEKALAVKAGLGFQGKNSLLINQDMGSFLFLGGILTDYILKTDKPVTMSCPENCNLCINECPQHAIVAPKVIDARRCNSYLTVENKNKIPDQLKKAVRTNIFGCDICQEVCPFNKNATITKQIDFYPKNKLFKPEIKEWVNLTVENFEKITEGTVLRRRKHAGILNNAQVVKENLNLGKT